MLRQVNEQNHDYAKMPDRRKREIGGSEMV